MKKVLVAYESVKGHTEKMANYIAEGSRMAGNEVDVKHIRELKRKMTLKVMMPIFWISYLPQGHDKYREDVSFPC